ncbi:Ger(x)C family germination protein [Paenibacillus rhizosphaerae]|uniref:Ger(X)C family germination protein n=1 Tax=Paenibacillus rhizosphaerae TaxID=297318 RepID=A0A839TL59_9BACL|nr:Ger(x)C family spore germination protein [Paenibacillus rhizosphaerae]MBB3126138.1 Ger(x)C family germination protein [Paenibacillus rhizosphaerae]
MKAIIVLLVCSLLLTGCWDLKTVQDMNIVTALGIDYKKDHYIVYVKLTDFSAVGTREGSGESKPASTWIGIGEGSTVLLAINDVYRSAQHHTLWTHVKAIVITKSALGKLEDIFDSLLRSRELRYTSWVYGTDKPITSIFTADTTLNQSPLLLEMFEPKETYKQRSAVLPIQLQQLVSSIREPATSVLLPVLSVTDRKWVANQKDKTPSMMELTGVFVINKGANEGWVAEKDMMGARLIRYSHLVRYPLNLPEPIGGNNTLNLTSPSTKISLNPDTSDSINLNINLTVNATVLETHDTKGFAATDHAMEQKAQAILKEDILKEFNDAKSKHIDLFGFEEWLYRHHYDLWKQTVSRGPVLSKIKVDDVKVKVLIKHANTYTID